MESTTSGPSNLGARPLTYGERAVGINFNPSASPRVAQIKKLYAQIIDILAECRDLAGKGEAARCMSVAITEAQTAQMWAVKGITTPLEQ